MTRQRRWQDKQIFREICRMETLYGRFNIAAMVINCSHHLYRHRGSDHFCQLHWQQPHFRRLLEGQHKDIDVTSLPESGNRLVSLSAAGTHGNRSMCLRFLYKLVELIQGYICLCPRAHISAGKTSTDNLCMGCRTVQ